MATAETIPVTTRRTLLGAIASAPVMAAPKIEALQPEDPHIAWWAEERRLWNALEAVEGDELDRLNDQRWAIRDLIVATPAATVAGMAVQVRFMSLWDEEGFEVSNDLYEMLEWIADGLDRMAGRAHQ